MAGVIVLVCTTFAVGAFFTSQWGLTQSASWGATFSAPYARYLGLDPVPTFIALLDNLKIRHFRLSAYWDQSEPEPGSYDFSEIDWQLHLAESRGADVLMAVGRRLPHWPECHDPLWLAGKTKEEQNAAHLDFVRASVERLRTSPAIVAWQVENEPFLASFGECPPLDEKLFKDEIEVVRSLDDRPIVITESGELSTWTRAARLGDVVGVSMYRRVLVPIIGFGPQLLLPAKLYLLKSLVITQFFKRPVMNTELQMEPWAPDGLFGASDTIIRHTMTPQIFKRNIGYARATGLTRHYLWGAEWWLYMKNVRGEPVYWELARDLFSGQ